MPNNDGLTRSANKRGVNSRNCLLPLAISLSALTLCHPIYAQESDSSDLREHVNRGNQLMARRQFAAAQAEYEAAKKIDPSNQIVKHNLAELFNNWGVTYFRAKSYSEAIAQFQKCLAVMPGHGNAKYNIQLCRRAMQNQGMNPDELPDAASEDKEKSKTEQAKDESKDAKEKKDGQAATTAPGADAMSVSVGNKTIFTNNAPFVSGSSVFPVYSEKNGAAKSTVNVINPAAMAVPGEPTITSTGVAVGSAPAITTTPATTPAATTASTNPPANPSNPNEAPTQPVQADAAKPKYNPVAPANSQPTYVPMPASYDSVQAAQAPTYNRGSGDSNMTLDEKVCALELKVYGKKHIDMPIMRRIDQLETDYIGQIRSGSMSERVEYLKKAIGQN